MKTLTEKIQKKISFINLWPIFGIGPSQTIEFNLTRLRKQVFSEPMLPFFTQKCELEKSRALSPMWNNCLFPAKKTI